MPTTNLALFLTASLALIVAPGPDNLYVLARGTGSVMIGLGLRLALPDRR
jgi:threonine/homoserine/homoserine lactone efflux protein